MSDIATYEVGAALSGYKVRRRENLEHVHGTYYELEHEKTGARHIHVACPDDNNTFGVLFPTVPSDSSGVAHILEHVVLAGSERFPVRDPFFSMIPRSLKTFMNALTSTDWTMYPFSTRNRKDFFNLLNVYLDAAFFPRIEEDSFKQEGHRFEFEQTEDANSGLRYKGVVFNEMKGAMASAPSVIQRALGKALFPELTYANNSGGEPAEIPNLTWEQLRNFHKKHYHPSNAFFFTYGNIALEDTLAEIEAKALTRFDKQVVDVAIPDVKRFSEPRQLEVPYPLAKEEDTNKKGQVLVGWVTTHVGKSFEVLSQHILKEVLIGNAGSPLRKALIDSGLGDALADATGFHNDYREAVFAVGLKGTNAEDAEKIESIILTTLEDLATNGLDNEQIDAAIHQLEIEQREVSNAGFPYSLRVYFQLSGAYIYGGDPYSSLQFDADVAKIEQARAKGRFFEGLIKTYLLDNNHRARLVLVPDQDLEDRQKKAELDKLAKIEAGLSDDQKAKIVADALRLKAAQEAKADLSSLPTLELSDVPMNFEQVPNTIEQIAGARVGLFPQPTNGLTYIDIRTDFAGLADDLKDYLPLFAYAVPKLGAGADDYVEMSARIAGSTGGIGAGAGVRVAADDGDVRQSLTITGKSLARNHAPFIGILRDFLADVKFEPKRLKDIIAEFKTQREAFVVQAGMFYAMYTASAKLSPAGVLDERMQGLTQLALLKNIAKLGDDLGEVIGKLEAIRTYLFRNDNLNICVTSEEKSFPEIRKLLGDALSAIPSGAAKATVTKLELQPFKHEAKTTSVPVAFNAKVFKTAAYTDPDAPAFAVLSQFMRATYLHREIREKGGAYGGQAQADSEKGLFAFWSYRDPNIVRTYQVFDDAVKEVVKGDIDAADVKEAILSACGAVDPLESPDTKGRRRFFDDMAGYTLELREQYKQRLLSVTEADLRRVAEKYLSGDGAALATLSNPDKIKEANEEMGNIFEVSAI